MQSSNDVKGIHMEIEMKIRGLMMDPAANTPIVILKEVNGESMLPIWVGAFEANAIALQMEGVTTPRPMTMVRADQAKKRAGGES